ncbi:uncharacterized protein F4822DRAFT_443998 [Hypoxylon trugodes]|uniref:uncharacterized protein n=1 Tax=Hypoxylon trugodes TaxID=326681 RepID=UPI002192FD0D|nr:uncharacterized protein F4822DRAFT_443998 [Hypoxylon trugodes]KAI1387200.1 hypothetical protein F4822DRAFT_443998 [Hypoxylon trugodes]
MSDGSTTLRTILTQKKPPITCNLNVAANTKSQYWPDIQASLWHGFDLNSLNNKYADMLDEPVQEETVATSPRASQMLTGLIIDQTKDVRYLLGWNKALMGFAVNLVKSKFSHADGFTIIHVCTDANEAAALRVGERFHVDHLIALDKIPSQALVVGLGKSSAIISLKKFVCNGQLVLSNKRHYWVLRQLANVCKAARTPYGYIQTDTELIVCRFRTKLEPNLYSVNAMPVPWSSHGPKVLTTDLALWWLCTKALSPPDDIPTEGTAASGSRMTPIPENSFQPQETNDRVYYDVSTNADWQNYSFDDLGLAEHPGP